MNLWSLVFNVNDQFFKQMDHFIYHVSHRVPESSAEMIRLYTPWVA